MDNIVQPLLDVDESWPLQDQRDYLTSKKLHQSLVQIRSDLQPKSKTQLINIQYLFFGVTVETILQINLCYISIQVRPVCDNCVKIATK